MKSKTSSARDHYEREKARRARTARPESELLAAAKREYLALLESEAAKGKGGRPKKKAAKKAATVDDEHGDDHSHDLDQSHEGVEGTDKE